jgi:hypothetical protein
MFFHKKLRLVMSKIFISWGAADLDAVNYLTGRFRKLGLTFFEYSDAMLAGDDILERIEEEIDSSKIAILCLSDNACARRWVISEVTLLYQALKNNQLKEITPLQVGTLNLSNLPPTMKGMYNYIPDVSTPQKFEKEADRFIIRIYKTLYGREPVMLPTVLLAMNKQEFNTIKPELEENELLLNMCSYLGMGEKEKIIDSLESRYGDEEAQFGPFCNKNSLIKSIANVTDRLNNQRTRENKKPVFLKWLNDEVFSLNPATKTAARDLLRSRTSLIIIDSLSTLHKRIKDQYNSLLFSNSAILWIPPFTQWTSELVAKTSEVIKVSDTLYDFFRDWEGESEKQPTVNSWLVNYEFGIFTQPGLNHWLYRIIEGSTIETPDPDTLAKMTNQFGKGAPSAQVFK